MERQLSCFETGAAHHFYDAVALALVGLASRQATVTARRLLSVASWLFPTGILLFSGSLYLYGLYGIAALIWVTPVGGLANIAGWLVFAFGLFRISR